MKLYDGNSSWSDLLLDAYEEYDNIIAVTSSGNEMFVTFSSDVYVGTGFNAKIYKTSGRNSLATFCTVTNPCKVNEGHCYHNQQCQYGLLCGIRNCPLSLGYANDTNCCYGVCNDWLDLKNGFLNSTKSPNTYSASIECSWTISAPDPNQIIKVQFLDDIQVSSIE